MPTMASMIKLKDILTERKHNEWQYQLRDIGGAVFYRRQSDADDWQFTDAETFAQGLADGAKLIPHKEKDD
jgi:hypothetical protein